jgi:Fe-S oxidoreductase
VVAELPRYAPLAARLAPLLNLRNRSPALRRLAERLLGFAADRPLPAWRRDAFRDAETATPEAGAGAGTRGEVLLFSDTFNRWFEPENLRAALRVLAAAGYRAVPATDRQGAANRPLCCGRTYLAAGMVERARAEARRTLAALAGDRPVVGLEPSCVMTLRDEFTSLLPGRESRDLAGRALLLSEFLAHEAPDSPIDRALGALPVTAHVHGHCHQKSFGAFPDALVALRRVPGLTVKPIASSCCGMAGSFGYEAGERYAVSTAAGERVLLPAVRAAAADTLIVADGFSCRSQIEAGSGRSALHAAQLLATAIHDGQQGPSWSSKEVPT